MPQKELSLSVRVVVVILGVFLLLVCAVYVPFLGREVGAYFNSSLAGTGVMLFIWGTAIIGYAALCLAYMIGVEIGRNNSFCTENARRLRLISRLALTDTLLYMALTGVLLFLNPIHPSVLFILMSVILFGVAATVAAAGLSHLTQKAADLKSESDLTI